MPAEALYRNLRAAAPALSGSSISWCVTTGGASKGCFVPAPRVFFRGLLCGTL
jgi:hypothetical protein